MVGWAMEEGPVGGGWQRKGMKPAGSSGIPVMGSGLVELVLRDGLGSGEIEGRGLVEVGQRFASVPRPGEGRERGTRGGADAADRDGGGYALRWRGG